MSALDDSYLFDHERPRFLAEASDRLVAVDDLRVVVDGGTARLGSLKARADLAVTGVRPGAVQALVAAIDGVKTLAELEATSGVGRDEVRALLELSFGVVIFAPAAIERLERALSGTEITRFPGSPYEIVRAYWLNMIDVRGECSRLDAELATPQRFREFLQRLNTLALAGADGNTPYTPASPISRKGVAPGTFLTGVSKTVETDTGTRFVAGPRVNVKLIGGEHYHRVVYERAGDPEALDPAREIAIDGLEWGRVVHARAETDAEAASWFCPPRPQDVRHFDALRSALLAALDASPPGAPTAVVPQCARFHWYFVRLHPFYCANQSLAMNLVNFVLGRSHGAGIPHLILDQLALRLTVSAYERVFETAVRAYLIAGVGPLTRYQELRARKLRGFSIIENIGNAPSIDAARAAAREAGKDAELALLVTERVG